MSDETKQNQNKVKELDLIKALGSEKLREASTRIRRCLVRLARENRLGESQEPVSQEKGQ